MMPVKSCMPTPASAPSVTVSAPSWPWILSVLAPVANTLTVSAPVPVLRSVVRELWLCHSR